MNENTLIQAKAFFNYHETDLNSFGRSLYILYELYISQKIILPIQGFLTWVDSIKITLQAIPNAQQFKDFLTDFKLAQKI